MYHENDFKGCGVTILILIVAFFMAAVLCGVGMGYLLAMLA